MKRERERERERVTLSKKVTQKRRVLFFVARNHDIVVRGHITKKPLKLKYLKSDNTRPMYIIKFDNSINNTKNHLVQ